MFTNIKKKIKHLVRKQTSKWERNCRQEINSNLASSKYVGWYESRYTLSVSTQSRLCIKSSCINYILTITLDNHRDHTQPIILLFLICSLIFYKMQLQKFNKLQCLFTDLLTFQQTPPEQGGSSGC